MDSESTSALGQPSDTKPTRGTRAPAAAFPDRAAKAGYFFLPRGLRGAARGARLGFGAAGSPAGSSGAAL